MSDFLAGHEKEVFYGMFRHTNSLLAKSLLLTVVNPDAQPAHVGTSARQCGTETGQLVTVCISGMYMYMYNIIICVYIHVVCTLNIVCMMYTIMYTL